MVKGFQGYTLAKRLKRIVASNILTERSIVQLKADRAVRSQIKNRPKIGCGFLNTDFLFSKI
jgi:hypothetical protein